MEIIGTYLRELTWNQTLASFVMVQESWFFNRITFACHFFVLLLLLLLAFNKSSLHLHGIAKQGTKWFIYIVVRTSSSCIELLGGIN